MELHTFSSLDKDFLNQYENSFVDADLPIIYLDPKVIQKKGDGSIDTDLVKNSFAREDLEVFFDPKELKNYLEKQDFSEANLLLMSSGDFGGIDLVELSNTLMLN